MADGDEPIPPLIDIVIRDIIARRHTPTTGDVERIIERMRTSTFSLARRDIAAPLRTLMIEHGHEVPARGNDLIYHWAKHALGDRQWTPQTTVTDQDDLQRAVLDPASRLLVRHAYSGHDVTMIVATTDRVIPASRLGEHPGPEVIVVYPATVGRILSEYMVAASQPLTESPSTIWLRAQHPVPWRISSGISKRFAGIGKKRSRTYHAGVTSTSMSASSVRFDGSCLIMSLMSSACSARGKR